MTTTADVLIGAPERSKEEGVVGYAYTLPLGVALPTNTTAPLAGSAEDLGFVSEDGLAISTDRSVEPIRDWNLDDVRLLLTEHSATITFTIISWTVAGLKAYFGAENVTETASEIIVKINGGEIGNRAWVFNLKDLNRKRRVVIPNGAISSQGEITFVKGENTPLEIELTALVDDFGEKIYIYTAKEAVVAPAWKASTAYTVGTRVALSTGPILEATVAGTSDATEPESPLYVGETVTDGTVTWKRVS